MMLTSSLGFADTRRFMRIEEVAAYTHISKRGLYHLIERGVLPATRLGRNYLVERKKLEALLEANRIPLPDGDAPPAHPRAKRTARARKAVRR